MVDQLSPAMVILDIMLPELDGLEVCRRLRAASNDLAIIMLTARDEDIDKILGLELGADDYLTKPLTRASWWQVLSLFYADRNAVGTANRPKFYILPIC